jgi:sodium/potassium/calcium exchanger 6
MKILLFLSLIVFLAFTENCAAHLANSNLTLECEQIYDASDKCAFARDHCNDHSGLISYVALYYCSSTFDSPFIICLYAISLVILFLFVAIAAGEYFCPNLHTIATLLGLSENITGVTFLALGNGSPDLFASFSAIQKGSSGLAIGELLGAGSFITTCVVGAIAISTGFRVSEKLFIRDIGFFLVAAVIVLFVLYDEKITKTESIILIMVYFAYVVMVAIRGYLSVFKERRRIELNIHRQNEALVSGENALIEQLDSTIAAEHVVELIEEANSPSPGDHGLFLSKNVSNSYQPWLFKHKTLVSLHNGYTRRSPISNTQQRNAYSAIDQSRNESVDDLTVETAHTPFTDENISYSNILASPNVEPLQPHRTLWEDFIFSLPSFYEALETFWPFINDWSYLTLYEKSISIISIPSSFLLTLTVPVIEEETNSVKNPYSNSDHNSPIWNRWLFLMHSVCVPFFISYSFGCLYSLLNTLFIILLSIAMFYLALRLTSSLHMPRYYRTLVLCGFLTSILWIYIASQEILVILQALAIILHISEAILGLTVLAIGNSLPDLVADLTVAKMGLPNMAIAACFGGPMLNILLGIGVSTLYFNISTESSYHLEFTRTLFLSAIGLITSLLVSAVFIPANAWKGTANYGYLLISIYAVIIFVNTMLEIFR